MDRTAHLMRRNTKIIGQTGTPVAAWCGARPIAHRHVCRMGNGTGPDSKGDLMDKIRSVVGGALALVLLGLAVTSQAFGAGNQAGNIDQWANSTNKWQNGDLNDSNS